MFKQNGPYSPSPPPSPHPPTHTHTPPTVHARVGRLHILLGRRRRERGRRNPELAQRLDLVVDEREQRRHDERDGAAGREQRGQLVADRLAGAGGQQAERVAAGHRRVDDLALQRAPPRQPKSVAQDGVGARRPRKVGAPPVGARRARVGLGAAAQRVALGAQRRLARVERRELPVDARDLGLYLPYSLLLLLLVLLLLRLWLLLLLLFAILRV